MKRGIEVDQNTRQRRRGGKERDIYLRLHSWSGSCYGDLARASEHSRFGGDGRGWIVGGVCPVSQSQLSAGLWHISHMQSPSVNKVTQRSPKKHKITPLQNMAGFLQAARGCLRLLMSKQRHDSWDQLTKKKKKEKLKKRERKRKRNTDTHRALKKKERSNSLVLHN